MTNVCVIWKIFTVLVAILRPANVQFLSMPMMPPPMPMPMPPMPPPMFMQPPMMMGAFAFRIPNGNGKVDKKTTTTTTTTTEANIAIVMPMPVPLPVQFGIPAPPGPLFCQIKPRPPNCPPCPPCVCAPSCTPAFFSFCSSCHLKCRCTNSQALIPMPPQPLMPVPGPAYPIPFPGPPAPVIVVPYPPAKPKSSEEKCLTEEKTEEDDSCSDDSSTKRTKLRNRKRKRNKKHKLRIHRRNMPSSESGNDNFVKPVLSYVSSNGDVMIKRAISDYDAKRLMGQGQKVRIVNGQNRELVVMSDGGYDTDLTRRNNMMSLRRGGQKAVLGTGKKELVFKPPHNKKISNLSVVFNVD